MLLEIFKDSFEYSYKDPKSILKFGVLSLLSGFFIPQLFALGYYYRITDISINGTINGEDSLPRFEKWGDMFIQGFKILIIRLIYLIPGTLIFLIPHERTYGISFFQNVSTLFFAFGLLSLAIVLWIGFYLLSSVAITNMINNNGSLKAAFNFKEIITIINSIGISRYIKFYMGCIILAIGIFGDFFSIISLMSGFITLIALSMENLSSMPEFLGVFIITVTALILATFIILGFLFLIPFFLSFESRAIGLIYNMREVN
jgi:hypothetical protein